MEKDRKLILVSNDDGIAAKGVNRLVKALMKYGDVICVCPATHQSGKSMAITFDSPLRIHRLKDYEGAKMYTVSGTPVDCVKLAMHAIVPRKPDLVVSGINHGSNAAVNVVYSGTMGAAFEACACGMPAVAFSLTSHDPDADFEPAMPYIEKIVERVLEHGLPSGECINVNIPNTPDLKGAKVVRAARGAWTDEYQKYIDPAGGEFYWLCGYFKNAEPDNQDTDEWCLRHGIISIVPSQLDRTAPDIASYSWLD